MTIGIDLFVVSTSYVCVKIFHFEGAAKEDGRGPSIWDPYTHIHRERIVDGSNGDVAVDQYHCYKEDVKIMKNMGLDAYRFSISCPDCYQINCFMMEEQSSQGPHLKQVAGIKPVVTLFHWDLPQALEDKNGGFLSPRIIDYAKLCYKEFGDRVKHWITLNEPYSFTNNGYAIGSHQNLNCLAGNSAMEPYWASHHVLLAHAAAVKVYKDKYQVLIENSTQVNGIRLYLFGLLIIEFMFLCRHFKKLHTSSEEGGGRQIENMPKGIWSHYPQSMRSLVGKPLSVFTNEESMVLNGSFDFLGLNYYTARYASHDVTNNSSIYASYITDPHVKLTTELNGVPIGPPVHIQSLSTSDWLYVYPKVVHDLLLYIKEKYNNPLIYITENGISEFNDPQLSLEEALSDTNRVDYYYRHIFYTQAAIKNGSKVKRYLAWSLLDNFEWEIEYTIWFGINYADYNNGLKRYPKLSAYWFKSFPKDSRSATILLEIQIKTGCKW
ncbi:hypothetical protein DVH24_041962 [Malus domestica]|uniref:Beta-glucosidase n=1 Tax=Malus domestica TaxID=3750 RepID=A0A498ISN5_MALDO|nr:hypothetical protein DVH24_041962 [Malus domestica]